MFVLFGCLNNLNSGRHFCARKDPHEPTHRRFVHPTLGHAPPPRLSAGVLPILPRYLPREDAEACVHTLRVAVDGRNAARERKRVVENFRMPKAIFRALARDVSTHGGLSNTPSHRCHRAVGNLPRFRWSACVERPAPATFSTLW